MKEKIIELPKTKTLEPTLYEPTEDTFRRIRERYQSFSECLILNTSSVKSVSLNKDDSIMYITNVLISQDHPEYQEFEVMMAMGVFTHLLDGTGRLTRL